MNAALVASMLTDSALPSGGHTQSGGLEPAIAAGLADNGRRLSDVPAYIRDRLSTVVRIDAGAAVLARHWVLTGQDPAHIIPHWAARTPSSALREAAFRQGWGLLRLAQRVWPGVGEVLRVPAPRSVVIGAIAAITEVTASQTAHVIAYDDARTVTSAALKLLPIDPIQTAIWLADLEEDIETVIAATHHLRLPGDMPSYGAPLIDTYAEQHVDARMRLFHA